jgi:hypothetical protein
MADITKCSGVAHSESICPLRDQCWRYLAPTHKYSQSWMETPFNIDFDGAHCNDFWQYGPVEIKSVFSEVHPDAKFHWSFDDGKQKKTNKSSQNI